jgi:hypothetical protein
MFEDKNPMGSASEMREALPDIDIAIREHTRQFLEGMALIAEESGQFVVERHFDPFQNGKLDVVNLRCLAETGHADGGGQLIAREERPNRVLVEMRARQWRPDPPTREAYGAFAKALIVPLLEVYNRAHKVRYRLRIQREGPVFPITDRTMTLFEQFAALANTASLHALDWERFYRFIRDSRQELPEHRLRSMLIAEGFSAEKASHLVELYEHLWAYKRV